MSADPVLWSHACIWGPKLAGAPRNQLFAGLTPWREAGTSVLLVFGSGFVTLKSHLE